MRRAQRRKFHYIYKITNKLNGKFYIGMHSTDNLNDGYFGSGTKLWHSINKYGKENHEMERLEFFENRDLLKLRETELVNQQMLSNELCLNIKVGGEGGWDHINDFPMSDTRRSNISLGVSRAHKEGKLKQIFKFSMAGEERHKEISSLGGKVGGGSNRISDEEILKRRELVKDVDFSKRGAISKAAKILGVSHTHIRRMLPLLLS